VPRGGFPFRPASRAAGWGCRRDEEGFFGGIKVSAGMIADDEEAAAGTITARNLVTRY
jgi:hypothetical protein